jgi:hypothetical protein
MMALRKSCRLRTSSQRMREVAPMFRFEECQSIGGNMRSAKSREKVARKIAEAYGWERSSGSGAEEGKVEFMVRVLLAS